MYLALALLSLIGCATWIDQEPGCGYNVYDWSDDLLAHIMAGDGSGTFDYDPEDTPRNSLKGAYDVNSGDYSWSVDYASSYYVIDSQVEGYGTAYHNGDLDILQTTTTTDVLADQYTSVERTKREGCQITTATASDESMSDALVQVGTYTDATTFEWEADVSGYTWQGSWHENLSRTETVEADDGSYSSQITTKPEGTADGDIAFVSGGYDYSGTYLRRFDGGVEETLTQSQGGETTANITTNYDYDGSGTETYRYPDGSKCDVVVTESQDCSYTCSDGSSGSC